MTDLPTIRLDELPPDDPTFEACGREGSHEAALAAGYSIPMGVSVTLDWLPGQLDRWLTPAGLKVVLVDGYATRGRPASSGSFNPYGYLVHHTATKGTDGSPHASLGTVVNGRPDLTGPLCTVLTAYDGTVYVVALGRANHAGVAKAAGPMPGGDGNALYIGNEVQLDGYQAMSDKQRLAVVLIGAAIFEHNGRTADYTRRHYDSSVTGKWDVGYAGKPLNISSIRSDITAALAAGPGDDMSAQDVKDIKDAIAKVASDVWSADVIPTGGTTWAASHALGSALDAATAAADLKSSVDALAKAVQAVPKAVWDTDYVPVLNPDGTTRDPNNPTWAGKNVLSRLFQLVTDLQTKVAADTAVDQQDLAADQADVAADTPSTSPSS